MTGDLSTLVLGNPESCRASADWLKKCGTAALDASARVLAARNASEAGWWGPASGRFRETTAEPANACDDLSLTCVTAEPALRDFADSIDKVNEKMAEAVSTATAGQLDVLGDGAVIVHPDKAKIVTLAHPTKPTDPDPSAVDKYNAAVGAYNAQVDAYNAKVKVFNDCSTAVKEARILEDQAHFDLESVLKTVMPKGVPNPSGGMYDGAGQSTSPSGWEVAGVSTSALESGTGIGDAVTGARGTAIKKINQLTTLSAALDQWGNAKRWDKQPSPALQRAFRTTAQRFGDASESQKWLLTRWEKGMGTPTHLTATEKWVPLGTQGRRAATTRSRRLSGPGIGKVGKVLGPLGAGLIVAGEVQQFAHGEQTLGATAVKSVANVTASVIGGAVGAEAGSWGGPVGVVVGTIAGGEAATEFADGLVDDVMPRSVDMSYNQEWADSADHAPTMSSPAAPPEPSNEPVPKPSSEPGPRPDGHR